MARNVETILRELLGGQALTIAHQAAQLEAQAEQIQKLVAELAALKANP